MKFSGYDFNEKLGNLSWGNFKKFFKDSGFIDKVKETPEEVFKKLGGKLPNKKEEGGN